MDAKSSPYEIRESIILENQGQKIFAIFHKPLQPKNYPALLICHGLGGHKVGRYRLYVTLAMRLAELGIATLRFDFRGSGDSEGEFSQMTIESEVSDAQVGLTFLREQPEIDKQRIGIFGRSLGGLVAILAASRDKNIKTIGLWAPLYDSSPWLDKWKLLHSAPLDSIQAQEMMTLDGQIPGYEFFKQLFSLRSEESVAKLSSVPLLLIHGAMDTLVTPIHAEHYLKVRLQGKGETKYVELPKSDHDFTHLEERHLALEETCRWFQKTL